MRDWGYTRAVTRESETSNIGTTLAASARGPDRLVGLWLVAAAVLLGAGLFLPAVTLRQFYLFEKQYSLAEGVFAFAEAGDWFLFVVVFAFSILFPIAKTVVCLALWFLAPVDAEITAKLSGWLAALSKWSMLDVFIIALMVLLVDGRLLSSADVHAGVIAFTAAVLMSTYAARRIGVLSR